MAQSAGTDDKLRSWSELVSSQGMARFCFPADRFGTIHGAASDPMPFTHCATGIYSWIAENQEAYVGRAVNVRARLRQHYAHHKDIIAAAFVECPRDQLAMLEPRFVRLVEAHCAVRNIKIAKSTVSWRPFDEFMDRASQDQFRTAGNRADWLEEPRRDLSMLDPKNRSKWRDFERNRDACADILRFLNTYIRAAVPRPAATEQRFWSVTWLGRRTLRLNVGQQEVLTLHAQPEGNFARIICPLPIGADIDGPLYETRDFASLLTLPQAERALKSARSISEIRTRNLHLARQTTPLHVGSHCPWLWQVSGHQTPIKPGLLARLFGGR